MDHTIVSIIIPMYNAEGTISQTLGSIFDLQYPSNSLDVIVVDNGSTDNGPAIAKKFPINLLIKTDGTIASVRNFGAQHAKGEVLCFVDSDCTVFSDWLQEALLQLSKQNVAATGTGYIVPENYSWVEKAWLYESKHRPFETDFIPAGNFVVKAEVFREVGGFSEELTTCEDADICQKIITNGHLIINNCRIRSIHLENPKKLKDFFFKERWYGINMMEVFLQNIIDKVFLMSLLFLLGHVGLFSGLYLWVFDNNTVVFSSSLLLVLFVLTISTLYRIKRSKKYLLFFQTFTLYYVYFAARVSALAVVGWKMLTRKLFPLDSS